MNHRRALTANRKFAGQPTLARALLVVLLVAFWLALAWAVLALPPTSGISDQVLARMPDSGVDHPVTAVLLNFRGYDTLLEIGVLLLAVIGAMALQGFDPPQRLRGIGPPGTILSALVDLLVPVIILITGYLLWAGKHAPGGAFQAGAVLGAGLILLLLSGMGRLPRTLLHAGLVFGFGIFLAIAGATAATGYMLGYPPRWAGALIMVIETALTLSIGIIIAVLFAVVPPAETVRTTRSNNSPEPGGDH